MKNKKSRKFLYIILLFIGTILILYNKYNEPKCYSVDFELISNATPRLADVVVREAVIKKYKYIDVSYTDLYLHIMTGSELNSNVPRNQITFTNTTIETPTFYGARSRFIKVTKLKDKKVGLYEVRMEGEIYEVFVTYRHSNYTEYIIFNRCNVRVDEIVLIRKK